MADGQPHRCGRCSTYPHGGKLYVNKEAIEAARITRGWSQTELARRVHVSSQYMCQIERGHRPTVSPGTFRRIRNVLNVTCPRDLLLPAEGPTATEMAPAA